ncbi:hydroxyproline-rich glycoprotein DZ-HRGP [Hirsutella rhossiliensis]|uniref:Hydroxyproline-rich glycoprotein DZ-HRGP n=1 Tax=Hirsutella rhossiliensis TaxID=111463 RepID=A0A9P8MVV9_9HYPO|nr:hydroxyproline-rich glycoprotein DZ-HRGP [Hirsutella rhossiliensis]KAH0962230.1 hydroxyproline-rich glycoprotein DZ-HRGP [Hirsutella rhossiliensis]
MSTPCPDSPPASAVQYAYMFEKNKGPTKQLDALLRAIARHTILELGDKTDTHLTPTKLAAFYRAVGGDYDALFVDMPHPSLSFIWQVTGCQHTLQPTHDDFAPPTIPALTMRGFSRWESLEILLGPEEHVPFMQYAVKNWDLKHPETGEAFPPDLPAHVFPTETDMDVDRWHKSCAARLRNEAASSADDGPPPNPAGATQQPEPRFTYVRSNPFQPASPRPRAADPDYFGRPVYVHVPARHAGQRRPDRSPHRDDVAEERMRRKSFSDYASAPPDAEPHYQGGSSSYLDPGVKRSPQPRRHSHPRRLSTDSSDSDSAPVRVDYGAKRRRHPVSPPPPSFRRFVPPTAPVPPPAAQNIPTSFRPHRSEMRSDEAKKRNVPSPLGSLRNKLSETMSNILPNGLTSDRPRPGSRQNSVNDGVHPRRSREPFQPSRLSQSYSDLDSDSSSDGGPPEGDLRRRRRMRDERERERLRRGQTRDVDRDWEEERDSGGRRERIRVRRPDTQRRTSSHADIDRQRDAAGWDLRDRDRARDERRKWERRSPEAAMAPPTTGVAGRRYPEPAYS